MQSHVSLIKPDDSFSLSVGGSTYSERPKAAEALRQAMETIPFVDDPTKAPEIGKYKGFTMRLLKIPGAGYKLLLSNPSTGYVHATNSIPIEDLTAAGAMQRVDNRLNSLSSVLGQKRRDLQDANSNLATYRLQADSPFEHENKLTAMKAELDRLEGKLQGKDVSDQPAHEFEMLSEEPLDGEKPAFRFTMRGDEPHIEPESTAVKEQAIANLEEPDKEPWQLPYEEWRGHESRIIGEELPPTTESQAFHKEQVLEAVEDDMPVPAKVIAEYKDLVDPTAESLSGDSVSTETGKTVTHNVLADYPDLAKAIAPVEATQQVAKPKTLRPQKRSTSTESLGKGVDTKIVERKGRFDINRDRAKQAKIVVPRHPKTKKELRLQKRWERTPNRLDKEGVDTKIVERKERFDINRDRAKQAKIVVPRHPKTKKELRLQKRWERTPNRLDKEGVDTKIAKPRIRRRNPFGRMRL